MQTEQLHTADFSQPQGVLNPLGAPMTGAITIEVFQPNPNGRGKWETRAAGGKIIKAAGSHADPFRARYHAAELFAKQLTPWRLNGQSDPNAERAHFHVFAGAPSLCGSMFHANDPSRLIILADMRRENQKLAAGVKMCPVCLSLIDRTPQAADRVGTLAGKFGNVQAVLHKGKVAIEWQDGTTAECLAAEVRPLFLEQFR
jgi:hypothetical protein